jgi:hypothetical protein
MDPSLTLLFFFLSAFGEISSTCCSLKTAIARVSAARVLSFWKMPPKHALALCKQKNLRFWGLTAQRGWALLYRHRALNRQHRWLRLAGDSGT